MLAIERKRTTYTFGTHHYCKTDEQMVDKHHLDECSHLKIIDGNGSDIVKLLESVKSIRDLDEVALEKLQV